MKCQHTRASWSRWEIDRWRVVATLSGIKLNGTTRGYFGQLICDCGAWLSLGPANDGGKHREAVAVEKVVATLAAVGLSAEVPSDAP